MRLRATSGVILVGISTALLLIQLLLQLTPQALAIISSLLLGSYLIITDVIRNATKQGKQLRDYLILAAENVVVDELLRDLSNMICECIGGCYSGVVGATGALSMYQMPFISKDQRSQLIQSCLSPDIDVQEIFMTRGGLLKTVRILIGDEKFRAFIDRNDNIFEMSGKSIDYEDEDEQTINDALVDESSNYRRSPVAAQNDLIWDMSKSDDSSTPIRQSLEDSSTSLKSTQLHTLHPNDNRDSDSRHYLLEDVIKSIGSEICTEISHHLLRKAQARSIRKFGILSGLALMIQMKYSRTARKFAWNFLHSSTLFLSTSVIVGSFLTLDTKKRIMRLTGEKSMNNEPESITTSSNIQYSLSYPFFFWKRIVQTFILRLRTDQKFRKRWNSVFVFIVLCYFRRRRYKKNVPIRP